MDKIVNCSIAALEFLKSIHFVLAILNQSFCITKITFDFQRPSPKKRKQQEPKESQGDKNKSPKLTLNEAKTENDLQTKTSTSPESVLGELQNMNNIENDPQIKIETKDVKPKNGKSLRSGISKENQGKTEQESKVKDENEQITTSKMDKPTKSKAKDAKLESKDKVDMESKTETSGSMPLLASSRTRQPHGMICNFPV